MPPSQPSLAVHPTDREGVAKPRVFIDRLTACDYDEPIRNGFEFLGASGRITSQDRVVVKPNLTFPTYRPGVMTSPEAIEALIRYLKNFTDHITVCESDSGGYNPFCMSDVFREIGLEATTRKYGVKLVNLTNEPGVRMKVRTSLRSVSVPVPRMLLDETDLFITMPVPKVHANTVISGAIKNQWGTIQNPADRLRLHPYFKEVIHFLNTIYPRTISVVDGRYGLTGNGPLRGEAVRLDWVMITDDFFVSDKIMAQLQGFSPSKIPYLAWILAQTPRQEPDCNCDWRNFKDSPFHLKRAWTDYPGYFAFHSRAMAYLGYESLLARPLHWLLYLFREPFY